MAAPSTTKPAVAGNTLWVEARALLDLMLDFSFKRFITPRLIRVLYALSLVAAVIAAFGWVSNGFYRGFMYGVFTLITAPLAFLLYALIARVGMELILAIFQIAEHARRPDRLDP